MELKNKVAIVTGGSVGIGRAIVGKLVSEGATVVIADINLESANLAVSEILKGGGNAFAVKADVSNSSDAAKMADQTFAKYSRIDILVNNAGIRFINPLLEQTEEEWRRTLDVNLTAPFLCCKAVIPYMLKNGKGKIVNISSVAGLFGRPERVAYCASKGGEIAFTKAAALDMRCKNIYINAVAPALIDTPLNSGFAADNELAAVWGKENNVGRWGKPSEVADAVFFLCSNSSDFISGTVLTVDGGWTAAMVRATEG